MYRRVKKVGSIDGVYFSMVLGLFERDDSIFIRSIRVSGPAFFYRGYEIKFSVWVTGKKFFITNPIDLIYLDRHVIYF
jgi:hypothetical protein